MNIEDLMLTPEEIGKVLYDNSQLVEAQWAGTSVHLIIAKAQIQKLASDPTIMKEVEDVEAIEHASGYYFPKIVKRYIPLSQYLKESE